MAADKIKDSIASAPSMDIIMDAYTSKTELTSHAELEENGSKQKLEPYIPADHRPSELSTSSAGALAHLLKASLGSGVLAMPLAYRNAGLAVGAVGTAAVGLICTHGLHILVRTSQEVCVEARLPALGYADTCHLVFQLGPPGIRRFASFARGIADWALAATHLGACCVYVVLMAESFKQITDEYGGPELSVSAYCAMCLVPLIPLTQITRLKYLVPFSALANVVWMISIGISMYYCLSDVPAIAERDLSTSFSSLPLFISTSLFAMEGVGVVMPMENEMDKPQQFLGCPGVLNISMIFVVVLYGFVGFLGYLKYGDEVRGSLTLNLPQDEILAQAAKVMVAIVLMLSYALIYYVPVDVVWRRVSPYIHTKRRLAMAVTRISGVLLTVGFACAVPRLELFMELVGAVCLSTLGLLLPALVDTAWRWQNGFGVWNWHLWKNIALALFSLVALVSGSTYAVLGLVQSLS